MKTFENVGDMALAADCSQPDSLDSVGAEWLRLVHDAAHDQAEWVDDGDPQDWVHEMADGLVPVYTHEMWRLFVDLGAYSEIEGDAAELIDWDALGRGERGADHIAAVALFLIAERLIGAILDEG